MKKKLVKPFTLTKNFLNFVDVKKVKCCEGIAICSFRHPEDNSSSFLPAGYADKYKNYIEVQKNAKRCMSITLECSNCFYNQKNILNVYKLRKKVLSHEDV